MMLQASSCAARSVEQDISGDRDWCVKDTVL